MIGPELGLTEPGMTIACCDSHTTTHGAFGTLAFGIGTSQVEHVLATQTLPLDRPETMRITIDGRLPAGTAAKDLILAVIAQIGTAGAQGYVVVEFAGEAVRAIDYLRGRPYAPTAFEQEAQYWRTLVSDPDAVFGKEVHVDATRVAPRVSWGTNPAQSAPLSAAVPDPADLLDARDRASAERALSYMELTPGTPLRDLAVDVVFVGSCTNGRIEDLRAAADVLRGRTVSAGVAMFVMPGSEAVRQQAIDEGLLDVFTGAGAELRHSGCSMCVALNEDRIGPGLRAASTNNRNFEGRQGPGARTHLVSPAVAAATAASPHRPTWRPESWSRSPPTPATAVPLRLSNVDTDQLVPARFAAGASRTAYARALLHDRRAEPGFVLNRPEYQGATIMVAGDNFGCGSSREMAVWALLNYGFTVVAPSFGAIFRGNSLKNGLLTVTLPAAAVEQLWHAVEADPALAVTADLAALSVTAGDVRHTFEFDEYECWRLLNGLDDITLTERHLDAIEAYERTRRPALPTVTRGVA